MVVSVATKRTANRLRERRFVLLGAQVGNLVLQIFIEMYSLYFVHSLFACWCARVWVYMHQDVGYYIHTLTRRYK